MNGLDGDRTFDWRQELIWLCGRLEDYVKVEPICREQLEATIRRFKPGPFRAFALVTLAWSIRMQGRLDEAAELYREALAMLEETEQREDPRTGWPLLGLAAIAEQQGDIETAEECLRRAWGNWNRVGRVGMANRTRDKLIDLYIDNGRVNDGLTLAHATLETLQRFSRDAFEDRERRLHDTERLARLYTAANRPEDARRMETRARYLREDIERERMEKAQTVQRFGDQTGADQPLNRKDEFAGPVFFHVGEII
jgi:tetratricopeptide (TPR) repeat protein